MKVNYGKHHNAVIAWLTLLLHHVVTGVPLVYDFWERSGIENATAYFIDDKPVIVIRFTNGDHVRLTAELLTDMPDDGMPIE